MERAIENPTRPSHSPAFRRIVVAELPAASEQIAHLSVSSGLFSSKLDRTDQSIGTAGVGKSSVKENKELESPMVSQTRARGPHPGHRIIPCGPRKQILIINFHVGWMGWMDGIQSRFPHWRYNSFHPYGTKVGLCLWECLSIHPARLWDHR